VTDALFINPSGTEQTGFTNPPLGLLYLAGQLEHDGYNVKLIDGCIEGNKAVERAVKELKPRVVGLTCLTPARHKAFDTAKMVKELSPETKVLVGGAHPTIMYLKIKDNYPFIDEVCKGEGEKWISAYMRGEEDCSMYKDLDDIPFPAWHLVDPHRYPGRRGHKGARPSVIFSRGCTAHCNFCSTWWIWKNQRVRSASNMCDELEILIKRGINNFAFADDAMTMNRQRTLELCEEIQKRDFEIGFHVTARTDEVDREVLVALKAAGCYEISFGIESGSQKILQEIHKGNAIQTNEEALHICREIGLPATALIMVGNRGESDETIEETVQFLKRTRPAYIGCAGGLWLLPGTGIYNYAKRVGYVTDDIWLSREPFKVFNLEVSERQLRRWVRRVYSYNRWLWFKHLVADILEYLGRKRAWPNQTKAKLIEEAEAC